MEIDQTNAKLKQKFEYYINYIGYQRRNDRWIDEEEIKIDEDEIS